MSDSIKVAIKVRPLIKRERDENLLVQWQVQGNSIAATDAEIKRRGDGGFHFDHIFDMNATNSDVFDTVVRPIVDAGVNGFNGTVFAYGQTSSGKTYTMMGTDGEPGIIPLAIEYMFDAISNTMGREFLLRVSYLEIYKERVNDLLNKNSTDLKLHEDANGQVIVKCKEEITNCPENVLSLMKKGDKIRRIGETNMNERSSRSHTIFRITIESRAAGSDSDGAIQVSQLNLVDLAGSERLRQTGATGERFKEGRHINLSLSALGLVIMQLSESPDSQKHVNFRDSKLTRLLQASLGGNAMTTIICAVTPAALEETLCTLSFASRAKSVKNKPQLNEVMSDAALLKRYAKQLAKLNSELEKLKNDNRIAEVEEMESRLLEKERVNQLLEERIELLKTRIVSGDTANQEDPFKLKSRRRRTWGGPGTFKQHQPVVFTPATGLPTIKEMSPEKPRRKSIIQSVDIMNHTTFQTAFADFELELIESERDRGIPDDGSDSDDELFVTKRRNDRRVKFIDDVLLDAPRRDSSSVTPEKRDMAIQTTNASPSTPKHVLYESIHSLTKAMTELREFTTLEKQIMCTHPAAEEQQQSQQPVIVKDLLEFTMEEPDVETKLNKSCNTEQEAIRAKQTLKETPELRERLADLNFPEDETLEQVIANLSGKLRAAEEESRAREAANLRKITDLEKQCQILKDMEEQSAIERVTHRKVKQKVTELESQIDALKDAEERRVIATIAQEESLARISQLEAENKSLKETQTLRVTETEVYRQASARISELERDLEEARNAQEAAESMRAAQDSTAERISELETELQKLAAVEAENALVKAAHEEALEKMSALQREIVALKEIERESDALRTTQQETQQQVSRLEETVETLKAFKSQNAVMKLAYEENLEKLSQTEAQLALLRNIEAENISAKAACKESARNVAELEMQVKSLKEIEEQNLGIKASYEDALRRISELENEIKSSKEISEQNLGMKASYEDALRRISELENQVSNAENQYVTEKTAREEALEKISQLQKHIERQIDSPRPEEQPSSGLLSADKRTGEATEPETEIGSSKAAEAPIFESPAAENAAKSSESEPEMAAVTETEEQLRELEATREGLTQVISEMRKEIESLTTERDDLRRMTVDLRLSTRSEETPGDADCAVETESKADRDSAARHDEACESNDRLAKRVAEPEGRACQQQVEKRRPEEEPARPPDSPRSELNESAFDASYIIMTLEDDKHRLATDLEVKVHELQEIRDDVQSLKSDIEKLQKTIYLLTTENMEMATKLSAEKDRSREAESNLQKTIDELYLRISQVTGEKIALEGDLQTITDQLESARSKTPEACSDEEQLLSRYQEKLNKLTAENIELASLIAEKNEELETIKESKSLLYDHECIYRDKVSALTERVEGLTSENNELSTDLIDKIEENDSLKEECERLRSKLERSLAGSEAPATSDAEQLAQENNQLRAEVTELKTKVAMLFDENEKFSSDLLEAMEDRGGGSRAEKSCNNSLQLSGVLDASVDEDRNDAAQEESREELTEKVAALQDKISHLKRLNRKLSELKLTSCTQCAHLKHLNESRRALKLEAKTLNRKLEELQRKFDRKCADTEALKLKASQEVNLSLNETTLNASFIDGMNVSYVDEKIQHLNSELQTLKEEHDKLSASYREKCTELEKLHDAADAGGASGAPKPRKRGGGSRARIDRIQESIEQVRDDIDELKLNSTNFASVINKFKGEKASLVDEINTLKGMNEELAQRASDRETSAATAAARSQILETEITSLNRAIEGYATRERAMASERVTLEVELEDLKAEAERRDEAIAGLHRTIDELNERLSSLKDELDAVTGERDELLSASASAERRHAEESDQLRQRCEQLERERTRGAEAEERSARVTGELRAEIEQLRAELTRERDAAAEHRERLAAQSEVLSRQSENEKEKLRKSVAALEAKLSQSRDTVEARYKDELDSLTQRYEVHVKESENELKRVTEKLRKYIEENENLIQEVARLRSVERKFREMKEEIEQKAQDKPDTRETGDLSQELSAAKESMIKELKSLKGRVNRTELLNKSVNEVFLVFLQALMSKEEEIVKNMREQFERDKQKLIDQKRQTADAEKRVASWAKELEAEIEKLQADLAHRDSLRAQDEEELSRLERALQEVSGEKQMLREKLNTLESEFSGLQAEFEKRSRTDVRQEEAVLSAQKREKEAQEAFKKRETELESKLRCCKESSEERIKELSSAIEVYKTKNMELRGSIEGLEATETQLKNIIEANTIELRKNKQSMHRMEVEMEQLTEAYNEASREVEERSAKMEEITALLKSKCDMLSEYKAKLETITPNYELLKEQVKDRKANIERYKDEIEALKHEREKQIELIQEKLNSEEMKSAGLGKQLNELSNKNVALLGELEGLRVRYEELQHENAKLERKVRNSTSKIKAETEIEELKDLNKRLQNNLEGASNRIAELQESKKQTVKELLGLRNQYELLSRESEELKGAVAAFGKSKENTISLSSNDDRYDALIREKNKIALELEGKKLLLGQREKRLDALSAQLEELTGKNKELDEELDDYAQVIRERDAEIAQLEDKLHSRLAEDTEIKELGERIAALLDEKEKLEYQLLKSKIDTNAQRKRVEELSSENEKLGGELKLLALLKKENAELQTKLAELENKLEQRSNSGSSRCTSPAFEVSRRRHSRNELFNQRRQLECPPMDETGSEAEDSLRTKIRELELQIVSKNGKIATLEMQIHSENFPYQRKCRDLEEQLLAFRNRNTTLLSEVKKLQRAMSDINALDCETCRRWRINKRDQGCQTVSRDAVGFSTTNTGVVAEHVLITKLERENRMSKDLCRSLHRRVKELQKRIKDLERDAQDAQAAESAQHASVLRPIEIPRSTSSQQQIAPSAYPARQQTSEKITKSAMKENVPANLIGATRSSSRLIGRVWNGNQ